MIYELGQLIDLSADDFSTRVSASSRKSSAQITGFAVDVKVKRDAAANGFIVNNDQFGPWDIRLDDFFVDIKSSSQGSVSVSADETKFSKEQIAAGRKMVHFVFEQVTERQVRYIGAIDFSTVIDRNKLFPSHHNSGYYYVISHIRKFLC